MKATLGLDYASGLWESNLKIIHFGSQTLGTFSGTENGVPNARYAPKTSADLSFTYAFDKNANARYAPKTSADLSFTYAFDKNTKVTLGGTNIFNVKPTKQDANETDNGFV